MERIREIEPIKAPAAAFGFFRQSGDRVDGASNGDTGGGVLGCDFHAKPAGGFAGRRKRQCEHRHGAPAMGALLVVAAAVNDLGRLIQGQGTAGPGRRDFPDAVAHTGGGADAGGPQRLHRGNLHGEQQGLGDFGAVQCEVGRAEPLLHRPSEQRAQHGVDFGHAGPEGRVGAHRLHPHADPLAAVAGEHEGEIAGDGGAAHHRQPIGAFEILVESVGQAGRRIGKCGETQVVMLAPARGGSQQRRRLARSGLRQALPPSRDKGVQGRLRASRKQQRREGLGSGGRRRVDQGRGAKHGVGVGSTKAEGVDAHGGQVPVGAQRPRLGYQREVERFEGNSRVWRRAVQRRRDHVILQHEQRLQQASHAAARLEVADIGLDGTDRQRRRTRLTKDATEGAGFDRIACRRAGAVCLDIVEFVRGDAEPGIGVAQQGFLGVPVGQRKAGGPAVRVDAGGAHHRANTVARRQCRAQRLEHHDTAALGTHIAICARIECVTSAARGQHGGAAEADIAVRCEEKVHAADQCGRHSSLANRLAREMQGHQRRRAGGIDSHARAAQIEDIRQPVGQGAKRCPGHAVGIDECGVADVEIQIVPGRAADENAGLAAREARTVEAGILDRLVSEFEK